MDLVIEIVGGKNIKRSIQVIKKGGTLVSNPGFNDEAASLAKEIRSERNRISCTVKWR